MFSSDVEVCVVENNPRGSNIENEETSSVEDFSDAWSDVNNPKISHQLFPNQLEDFSFFFSKNGRLRRRFRNFIRIFFAKSTIFFNHFFAHFSFNPLGFIFLISEIWL